MLERFFKLSRRQTTPWREAQAGLTTFAAMSYILAVNPTLLAAAGMDKAALVTVTALAAAIGTALMAVLTNTPIALAPGMGLNAYFAFSVCLGMGVAWQSALGLVFVNGIIFMALSASGIRTKIVDAIPNQLKVAITCGIGLFIAFLGLRSGGIIIGDPNTFVTLGDLGAPPALLVFSGIILTAVLITRQVPGAIILGILLVTVLGLIIPGLDGNKVTSLPESLVSLPPSIAETAFKLDFEFLIHDFTKALPIIVTLLFVDLFDTVGTLIGVCQRAGLLDRNGKLPKVGRALMADSTATVVGALLGTSTTTSYIESAAGVEAGGRTGLTSLTTALCFLLALFFTPVILAIPAQATAPALVIVGIFMMQSVVHLDLEDFGTMAPAVLTIIVMPLAFSISAGIGIGMIAYSTILLFSGRRKELGLVTVVLAVLFLIHFCESLLINLFAALF
ncbi:MAG: NCS2 family permease [Verrucomicrobia bacterium]|nr:MAG: NCS2 family permease [Verrucomicrobiota bacterium]